MTQDYGAGLTVDDLIGLRAIDITSLSLPNETAWQMILKSAQLVSASGFETYLLAELWGDGHVVWQEIQGAGALVTTPAGEIVLRGN